MRMLASAAVDHGHDGPWCSCCTSKRSRRKVLRAQRRREKARWRKDANE